MKCSFIIQVHIYLICQLRQLSELRRTKFLVLNKFSYKFSSKIYFVFFFLVRKTSTNDSKAY